MTKITWRVLDGDFYEQVFHLPGAEAFRAWRDCWGLDWDRLAWIKVERI